MAHFRPYYPLDLELQEAFGVTLEIQSYLANNLKPEIPAEGLLMEACELAARVGFGPYFMGTPGENVKFVGHRVGLEADLLPILARGVKVPLRLNQAIALEPKFVFPGKGAVGIENTFVVGENGGVRITEMDDAIVYL